MMPINSTTIAVLPIGEFDTEAVKIEFDRIINGITPHCTNIIFAEAINDKNGAERSIQEFSDKSPDLLLIIPLRGLSAQTIESAALLSPFPVLIWPIQGRFALPSTALAIGALSETIVPIELLYISPDHPSAILRFFPILRAARAYSRLRKSRIGVIGSLFPNLVSCRYDAKTIAEKVGVKLHSISFEDIRNLAKTISNSSPEFQQLRSEISNSFRVNDQDKKALDTGTNLHMVLNQIARDQDLAGFATECWSAFPRELGLNPCMGFIEDSYSLACEGDVMLCISLLIVRYLTDVYAYVGDLFDLDMNNILTLIHCGGPASLAADKGNVTFGKSQLALERGFETLTCRPIMDNGPVTVFRFYGQECNKLHLASGELINCDTSSNLTVKVKMTGNRQEFLDQCFGNHYLVVPGDIRSELKILCKWFSITVYET